MLYVIYDLDKTSLYCPIAMLLDKQRWLHNLLGNNLFYSLYTFAYKLEHILKLFKVNNNMYLRAKFFEKEYKHNVTQIVCTARHLSNETRIHKWKVFKDLNVDLVCTACGYTGRNKAQVLKELYNITSTDNVIVYDDNSYEIYNYKNTFKNIKIIKVDFKNNEEIIF